MLQNSNSNDFWLVLFSNAEQCQHCHPVLNFENDSVKQDNKKKKIRECTFIGQLNRQKKLEEETGRIQVLITVIASNVKAC